MATASPTPPASGTIQCSVCQEHVPLAVYAQHIQEKHPAPASATAPPLPAFTGPQPFGGGIMPVSGPIKAKDLSGGHYLKGTDVPDGVSEVRFKALQFVSDPQGRSKLAVHISETYGKSLFGLNVTNIRALASLGFEDLQAIVGKTIVCMVGMQPNPQRQGLPTKSLFVFKVE